jgi:hypothetical protein
MLKTFELIPMVRCGEIEFLSDRVLVRKSLGNFTVFTKSKQSENSTDNFGYCHAYYNAENKIVAIEFFTGADLEYKSYKLFELTPDGLVSLLETDDKETIVDEFSVFSRKLGVRAEKTVDEIKSVLICAPGYFD